VKGGPEVLTPMVLCYTLVARLKYWKSMVWDSTMRISSRTW